MDALDSPSAASAASAACAVHRDRAAAGACARCGAFFCELDQRAVDGKLYCASCAAHPEVDWLGEFQRQCWGRRDLGAWIVGACGVLAWGLGLLLLGARLASSRTLARADLLFVLGLLVPGVVCVLFFFGLRFARWALVACPVALEALFAASGFALPGVFVTGFPFFVSVALLVDTRSRLFFRIPVPEPKLRELYEATRNNAMARVGFSLSFLGLVLPPVAPVALALSVGGLLQVDARAARPVGRKRPAVAGIVLGAVGTGLGAVLVYVFARG